MKAVIFDFDGTIADSFPFTYEIVKELAPKYGYESLSKQEIESLRELPFREIVRKYRIGPIKLFRMTLDAHSANASRIDRIALFPDLAATLARLREDGFCLAIMSSNSKRNIVKFLKKHNIEFFEEIETSLSLFGKSKKLRKIIRRLRLRSEDVIYVGDEVRDIEAAREAGIKIVSVTWGYNTADSLQKKNSLIADDVAELATIIEKTFK